MDKQLIKQVIQESFDGLWNSEMIAEKILVSDDTVIIGQGSLLDSIAFITLFSDIEDRLSEKTGTEIFLVLGDIHEFNESKTALNVGILSDYIATIIPD
jgi:hypothetical protein